MTPDEKLNIWEDIEVRCRKFFFDIEDLKDSKFAPYGKTPDSDTPSISALFDALGDLTHAISQHVKVIRSECEAWEREQDNINLQYDAWALGLCPNAMKEHPLLMPSDWVEVSKLLTVNDRSYEATNEAFSIWQNSHKPVMNW